VQSLDIACRVSRYRASVQEPLGLLHTGRGNACRAAEVDAYEKAIRDWLSRNASLCATELRAVSREVAETLASVDVRE